MMWLIYIASILLDLKIFLFIISILLLIISVSVLIVGMDMTIYEHIDDCEKKERKRNFLKTYKKNAVKFFITSISLALITVFIPTERTVYLMMGVSSIKEIDVTSELSKARSILNLKLDKLLEKTK